MNETGNERHNCAETVPAILEMEPKAARMAWMCWMADHDLSAGTELYASAKFVLMSIEMVILNLGRDAEPWTRKRLAEQLATFAELLRQWRG